MSFVRNEHPARTQAPMMMLPLPLEDALAFADACELTSDEELGDFADVDIHDAFLAKDAMLVDALSLADPAADDAHTSVLFSTDAFFNSDMSMQELHTIDLGQITAVQAKNDVNSNTNRRSRAKSTSNTARTRAARRDNQNAATRRQRACSTAAKHATVAQETAAKVVPMTSDSASNPPAKKRIRRQREELLYLREKVKVLERSLSTLRLEQGEGESVAATDSTDSTDSSSLVENEEDEEHSAQVITDFEKRYKVETPSDVTDAQASLWEGVASRQYSERERAEHENRHLKEALEKQIELAKSLEHILQNQPTADVSGVLVRLTTWQFNSPVLCESDVQLLTMADDFQGLKLITNGDEQSDRDAVFDQLIGEVTRAFSNFDLEVDAATLATMKREIEEVKVESCLQKGLAVRFSIHKRIPFSQQAVSNGMWKFIGLSGPRMESYYYREVWHSCISGMYSRSTATNAVIVFAAAWSAVGEQDRAQLWLQGQDGVRDARFSLAARAGTALGAWSRRVYLARRSQAHQVLWRADPRHPLLRARVDGH
jgi:hypothetical protein